MASFSQFGNDLYTGARSYDIVGRRRLWYTIAIAAIAIAALVPFLRGGFVFGIEFTGGSQFQISGVSIDDTSTAADAVTSVIPDAAPRVSTIGADSVRVQTDVLSRAENTEVQGALATAYDIPTSDVSVSSIGASWGQDVTGQAIRGLLVFLVLAAVVMAIYFRTWK